MLQRFFNIVITVGLIVFGTGCASKYKKAAYCFNDGIIKAPYEHIGEISEQTLCPKECGYIITDDAVEDKYDFGTNAATPTVLANSAYTAFLLAPVLIPMNYAAHQSLGRIWDERNGVRRILKRNNKNKFDTTFFDKEYPFYIQWVWDTRPWLFGSRKNMWIFVGPEHFGKKTMAEITEEDLRKFEREFINADERNVKVKFQGYSALKVGLGYASIFELISIEN